MASSDALLAQSAFGALKRRLKWVKICFPATFWGKWNDSKTKPLVLLLTTLNSNKNNLEVRLIPSFCFR